MEKDYEKIALIDYIDSISDIKYLSVDEKEIETEVCRYLLNIIRYDTNSRIVESLLA